MSTAVQQAPGITSFEVTVGRSKDYQSASATIRYDLGRPVTAGEMIGPYTEVEQLAAELAEKRIEQLVAEKQAKVQAVVEQQRALTQSSPVPAAPAAPVAPAPALASQTRDVVFVTSPYPNKRGQVKYRPTSDLSTDELKAMVTEAIRATGGDPSKHSIYDERTGNYGLETKGSGYKFCSVKPSEDNPAYAFMLKPSRDGTKQVVDQSFFVDFNQDGTVRVKPTDGYLAAAQRAVAAPAAAPAPSGELPF